MKKIQMLLLMLCIINQLSSQTGKVDTIIVVKDKFTSIQNIKYSNMCYVYIQDSAIYLSDKKYSSTNKNCNNSLNNFINKNYQSYFKFYDKKNRIIEEGNWSEVYFNGYYRSYYKNGKIKSEGRYISNIEIGTWIYYRMNGKVNKIVNYPKSIIGEYDRDNASIDIKTKLSLYSYDFLSPQDSINFVESVKGRWIKRYR